MSRAGGSRARRRARRAAGADKIRVDARRMQALGRKVVMLRRVNEQAREAASLFDREYRAGWTVRQFSDWMRGALGRARAMPVPREGG